MNRQLRLLAALLLVMTTVFVPTAAFAQDGDIAPADIVNDEGGPVVVTGEMNYTNPFVALGVAQPIIVLEDQAGFIDRDELPGVLPFREQGVVLRPQE